jgi:excisionase family DNA binding protein
MSTFLSAKQAARYRGVSTKTVLRWIESGRLTADKRGRAYHIPLDDLEPFRRRDGGHSGDSGHAGHGTADVGNCGHPEDSGQDGLLALVAQLSDKLAQQAATTAMWQTRAEVLATRLQQAEDTIRALEAPREAPTEGSESHTAPNLTPHAPEPTRGATRARARARASAEPRAGADPAGAGRPLLVAALVGHPCGRVGPPPAPFHGIRTTAAPVGEARPGVRAGRAAYRTIDPVARHGRTSLMWGCCAVHRASTRAFRDFAGGSRIMSGGRAIRTGMGASRAVAANPRGRAGPGRGVRRRLAVLAGPRVLERATDQHGDQHGGHPRGRLAVVVRPVGQQQRDPRSGRPHGGREIRVAVGQPVAPGAQPPHLAGGERRRGADGGAQASTSRRPRATRLLCAARRLARASRGCDGVAGRLRREPGAPRRASGSAA